MNRLCMAVLALSLGAGFAAAHEGAHDEKAEAGGTTTLSGELVDMGCYLSHGGAGEKHAKCGKMCVMKGGQPLGLVTNDGALYLVVGDHGDEKTFTAAKEMAGGNAKLSGKLLKKGGMQALMVSKVEKP